MSGMCVYVWGVCTCCGCVRMLGVYVHVGDVCVHVVLSDLAAVSGQALELGGPVTRGRRLEGPLAGAACWACVELQGGPGPEPA